MKHPLKILYADRNGIIYFVIGEGVFIRSQIPYTDLKNLKELIETIKPDLIYRPEEIAPMEERWIL